MPQQSITPQAQKGIGCFKIGLVILALIVLGVGGFFYFATAQLRRSDEEVLRTYQPSAEIADIAEKNALTDKGKANFYRDEPVFVDNNDFVKYCQLAVRGVEALGCNAPKPGGGPFGGRQIFLLKIDDPKFIDHKYSAAVHEMLHSIYNRLNSSEEKRINALLEQEFAKRQDDPHLLGPIEILKNRKGKNANKSVLEELHSKFGVEYLDLLPELEEYYKQYFKDRRKVVELFRNGGFNSRVRKMDQLTQELKGLSSKLTSMNNQLTAYKNAGEIDKFNALVSPYNSMVSQYNSKAREINKYYKEVEKFYQYFDPDYKPPEEKR